MIVLKILLIILLVVVGLLLLILFFPLHYSIHGKSNGTWNFYVDVNWLFYFAFFRVHVNLEDKEPRAVLRILGIPITLYPRKEKKQKQTGRQETEEAQPALSEPDGDGEQSSGNDETGEPGSHDHMAGSGKKKQNLIEKIKKIPALIGKIRTEVLDPHNKEAIKHLLAEAKGIYSHCKPRRIRFQLVFSTGDPATTGKVLGGLSLVPLVYRDKNRIVPDFVSDTAYVKGRFLVSGHIILFFVLTAAVRLMADRNIRRLTKHVKTLRGS